MGLDTVELVIAIEEEFGFEIPNSDAERLTTVREIYEYVKATLNSQPAETCLRQRLFYKLRRALVENYSLQDKRISPQTRLCGLVSFKDIEDGWPFLQLFIDLKTPGYKEADEILRARLSAATLTVGELVVLLIELNHESLKPAIDTEEEVWDRLVRVIERQLNVDRDEIVPAASITRDLGAD